MAKEITGYVKLQIKGGQANPAPPVGPALGQRGINIMEFCKAFNEKTKAFMGKPVPVVITVYKDKKFDFVIKSPPASHFIREAAKLKSGSKEPGRVVAGSITVKQPTSYPPYNINKLDDFNYQIEMALAGFSKSDIEVKTVDGQLTIKSIESETKDEKETLHRGISKRKFSRTFTLADDIKVNGAELKDGMLLIDLEKIVPEEKKPQTIDIK